MLQEIISGFGAGASLTGLRQVGLRPRVKIPRQDQQPFPQSRIAQVCSAELFLCPVSRSRGRGRCLPAQTLARLRMQSIQENPLHRLPAGVLPVLTPSPCRPAYLQPVGRPIAATRKTLRVHEAFHQQGPIAVAFLPVVGHLLQRQTENMRSQVVYTPVGQNQKAAVGDHLLQVFATSLVTPANPLIPRGQLPSCATESQSTQPLALAAVYGITHLCPTKRPGSQVVIALHHLVPEARGRAIGLLNGPQAHRLQGLPARLR